jgi:hypothetical protein
MNFFLKSKSEFESVNVELRKKCYYSKVEDSIATSCLILLYKRPTFLKQIIQTCKGSGIKKFFFAVDGPKNDHDRVEQELMLAELKSICLFEELDYSISMLQTNRGILINMVSALDWFFNQVSFGIVLEDDTIPEKRFIEFVQGNSSKLQNENHLMMLSGWRGSHSAIGSKVTFEYSSYPLIWGWATSAEKWQVMREWFNLSAFPKVKLLERLNPTYGFWRTGYLRVTKGTLDSWANILAVNFVHRGYKSIVPPQTLVNNLGFDEFATNSTLSKFSGVNSLRKARQDFLSLDEWLEKLIFRISTRHLFAPVYAPILDFIKNQPKRARPLELIECLTLSDNHSLISRDRL